MTDVHALAEHVVRQGAALLDQVSNDWWKPERVDLGTLDIGSGSLCLLAQSFGDNSFGRGVDTLVGLLVDAGHGKVNRARLTGNNGFRADYVNFDPAEFPNIRSNVIIEDTPAAFISATLYTKPWVKVITERREAMPASDPLLDLINASE